MSATAAIVVAGVVGIACGGEVSLESEQSSIDVTAPHVRSPLPSPASTSPASLSPASTSPASTVPPSDAGIAEAATSSTVPSGRVTMAFTGDVLAHRAINRGALQPDGTYDYVPMFANIAPLISSVDLAVCHLESPVGPNGEVIVEPERIATAATIGVALASAGYDRCSTASNHSLNGGVFGVAATITALESAGVGQSGMAASAAEVLPPIVEINGVKVAHLAYSYGFDGDRTPVGEPYWANLIDPARIVTDASAERELGAEVVVVSLHWGSSRAVRASDEQRRVAEAVTAFGVVDLIVGHHAHVLQPIEQVNGVWVAWGLGNHLSNHPTSPEWPASSQDGIVLTVAAQRGDDGVITIEQPVVHPTWCDRENGWIIRLTTEANDPNLGEAVREQLRQSHDRTATLLGWFLPVL